MNNIRNFCIIAHIDHPPKRLALLGVPAGATGKSISFGNL